MKDIVLIAPQHLLLCLLMLSFSVNGQVFRIGKDEVYSAPSEVARIASHGDVIEIQAGDYLGDTAVWDQDELTIRGINGIVHLRANGHSAENKAIWVLKGKDVVVENIEFSGAAVKDRNGAGIRFEGENLIVRKCNFHHNENGLLSGNNATSSVVIENSIFSHNGYGDGYSHNLYVGKSKKLEVRYSYFNGARVGHQIKSRAKENFILYNRISDEETGKSSYLVDIPNGGSLFLIGNLLQQGELSKNRTAVSYATENKRSYSPNIVAISNNTFVNNKRNGIFIRVDEMLEYGTISNNIFSGEGKAVKGYKASNNNYLTKDNNIFCNAEKYDYRIRKNITSNLIENYELIGSVNLLPMFEYKHTADSVSRENIERISPGAYEYQGGMCK